MKEKVAEVLQHEANAILDIPVDDSFESAIEVILSLIHISEPTRRRDSSRMPSSA